MALAETTLSVACAQADKTIVVASATSLIEGRRIVVDGEAMQVTKGYVIASTTVPVRRGQDGTAQVAHPVSTRIVHGNAADFGNAGAGSITSMGPAGLPRKTVAYSATGTLVLPQPGEDQVVVLNGTAITLTVPVPTKDLDNCRLTFVNSSGAAHVLTFTGGLGGASTGYTTVTFNATGTVAFEVIANNEVWCGLVQIPASGTVTNVTAAVA